MKQAKKFNVKKVIITDLNEYNKYKYLFKKNKINFYFGLNNLNKVIKKKSHIQLMAYQELMVLNQH